MAEKPLVNLAQTMLFSKLGAWAEAFKHQTTNAYEGGAPSCRRMAVNNRAKNYLWICLYLQFSSTLIFVPLIILQMLTFKKQYFVIAFILFVVEVLIALFVHDNFIRPFFGDFLVVVLIYCFLRAFLNVSPMRIAIGTLLFSFSVEFAQYFKIIEILGLKGNPWAEVVIGTHFNPFDLLAYFLGVLFAYVSDNYLVKHKAV